jgi:hypothetical protein
MPLTDSGTAITHSSLTANCGTSLMFVLWGQVAVGGSRLQHVQQWDGGWEDSVAPSRHLLVCMSLCKVVLITLSKK